MRDRLTNWLPERDPRGPITCAQCGCRLTEASGFEGSAWRHYHSLYHDRDARGCRPSCIHELHDAEGTVIAALEQIASMIATDDHSCGTERGSASA